MRSSSRRFARRAAAHLAGFALSLIAGCDGTVADSPDGTDEDIEVAELTWRDPFESRDDEPLGAEVAVPRHLRDGEELAISTRRLLRHGERLFTAMWTSQEGGGRPLTKGTGAPLTDPNS